MIHKFDVIIVGAGGVGFRAAVEIPKEYSYAVLSKVFPTHSHIGTSQGGVCAALGNEEDDSWFYYAFDTVKGSDYLGDQDAIGYYRYARRNMECHTIFNCIECYPKEINITWHISQLKKKLSESEL